MTYDCELDCADETTRMYRNELTIAIQERGDRIQHSIVQAVQCIAIKRKYDMENTHFGVT